MTSKARIIHEGPWQIAVRAENVLCPDGVRRTAKITGQPSTVWSMPASVKAFHVTISGEIVSTSSAGFNDLEFIPSGKNYTAFGIVKYPIDRDWSTPNGYKFAAGRDTLIARGVPESWVFTQETIHNIVYVVARKPGYVVKS